MERLADLKGCGGCGLGAVLDLEKDDLIAALPDLPLGHRRFIAQWYPEAHIRRAALKTLGVAFANDTSFVNLGFTVIPNSPQDVHVYIGRNVSVAPGVTCVCDSSANNGSEINTYRYVSERLTKRADIVICDEAWIGANSVILPGVTVGRCAVVGAGCVLTRDADDYGIYAGVPGRKIGDVRKWEDSFNGPA